MTRIHGWIPAAVLVLGASLAGGAAAGRGEGRLTLVEANGRDDLAGVVSVAVSPDGKFVYAASFHAGNGTVFARDARGGKLAHVQTVADETLAGTTALSISPDGRFAVATAFGATTAVLFERDPASGKLTRRDVAHDGERGVRFQWPIDAAFSPDSRFVYVIDDHGPAEGGKGAVVAFRIGDGKLELAGTDEGKGGCYAGARGIAVAPDGRSVFVACSGANTLVAADRDPVAGTTSVRQVVKDEEGDVHALGGAMGVAVSPDGRSVYVSSGRFHGDDAVSAYAVDAGGRLTLLQEFVNGAGALRDFKGGNELTVSPDGRNVYAAATLSGTVASFSRDPRTGELTYLDTIPDGGKGGENGAAGITTSRDGRFVYVATEDHKTISVFAREAEGLARR